VPSKALTDVTLLSAASELLVLFSSSAAPPSPATVETYTHALVDLVSLALRITPAETMAILDLRPSPHYPALEAGDA
jgi:hypothetical protein